MAPERPSWLPERLFPFESRFVDIDGNRVHYVDEGSGPPLVFLHGNPTYSFLYRDIVKALRDDFRCIALDYPGFGLSAARQGYGFTPREHSIVVEQFILELDLSGITLMAQDYGGPIGFGAAGRQPDRFKGFVAGNTFAWPWHDDPDMRRFSRFAGGPLGKFLIMNFNAFVNLGLPMATCRREMTREIMDAYRGPFLTRTSRYPAWVLPHELLASEDFFTEVADNLLNINHLPLLLTWGDQDRGLRLDRDAPRFQQIFPEHRLVVLEGANHYIQEDAPDEIAAAIRAWWADVMVP